MKTAIFRKFGPPSVVTPQRTTIIVPAFSAALEEWTGGSRLLTQFELGNDYLFSIKLPVTRFGANFVFAVRWVEDGVTYRFKFWEDVGEVLHFPVYSGERIGENAVFEAWSVNSTGAATLVSAKTLQTSILLYTNSSCSCTNTNSSTTLVAADPEFQCGYDNPFCDSEGGGESEEDEPGGGFVVTTDSQFDDGRTWWVFPASGYGIESDNPVYPSNVTSEQAAFWAQLLQNEWDPQGIVYTQRVLAWHFYNHIVSLYDFLEKFDTGDPSADPGDVTFFEFASPWTLTYVWTAD